MGRKAIIAFMAVCLSAPALSAARSAARAPEHSSGTRLFFEGLALSYDGDHDAARAKFAEYGEQHPDDLLARLRTFDDRMFDVRSADLSKEEYHRFLDDVNAAIAIYEARQCSGTDLKGIGHGTIDCDYIAASLYSMRMALRWRNEGAFWKIRHYKLLGADNERFFLYAHRSKSLQAKFLLGVHEYEIATSRLRGLSNDPKNLGDAIDLVSAACEDKSPFAPDVWFFVLRTEIENRPGAAAFNVSHPAAEIIAALQPKYPHNRIFRGRLSSSFSDQYGP